MDYVNPPDVVRNMVNVGSSKLELPGRHLVIRRMLAGAIWG